MTATEDAGRYEAFKSALDEAFRESTRIMVAGFTRPGGLSALALGLTPGERRAAELRWIADHGEAAMWLIESDARAEDDAREWERLLDEACDRIEAVFA